MAIEETAEMSSHRMYRVKMGFQTLGWKAHTSNQWQFVVTSMYDMCETKSRINFVHMPGLDLGLFSIQLPVNVYLGRLQTVAAVLEFLLPTWDTQMEFLAYGCGPA